jgi:alpha-ketoglutarate-dependent 2,4-dichlorophenoxyacetate dioxygenase
MIVPINDGFAAEFSGADLTQPVSDETIAAIETGMDRYAVLVFRDQALNDDTQRAFTHRFGPLEAASGGHVTALNDRRLPLDMQDASNLDQHQRPLARGDRRRMFNLGNRLWHSDSSYRPVTARYSLLSGRVVVNKGGRTEFADMRAAYDTLDDETKVEIEDLMCEHSLMFSRAALGFTDMSEAERAMFEPVRHRLVRVHPVTGRKSLFLSAHAGTIAGWPVPEARAFLRDLNEHATQRRFVYSHAWRRNDFVIWDHAWGPNPPAIH